MGNSCAGGDAKQVPNNAADKDRSASDAVPVFLNVYNLQEKLKPGERSWNATIGFGIYHSGVEIFGREFSFGGAPGLPSDSTRPGIFVIPPKMALPPDQFHERIQVGLVHGLTLDGLRYIVQKMNNDWLAAKYHLLAKNCNSFSDALLKTISQEYNVSPRMRVPDYVNRAARLGDALVPKSVYEYFLQRSPQAPAPPTGDAGAVGAASAAAATSTTATSTDGASRASIVEIDGAEYQRQQAQQMRQAEQQQQQQLFHDEEEMLAALPIPTKEEMQLMSIKEIKGVMWVHSISWENCLEKEDLIKKVLEFAESPAAQDTPFMRMQRDAARLYQQQNAMRQTQLQQIQQQQQQAGGGGGGSQQQQDEVLASMFANNSSSGGGGGATTSSQPQTAETAATASNPPPPPRRHDNVLDELFTPSNPAPANPPAPPVRQHADPVHTGTVVSDSGGGGGGGAPVVGAAAADPALVKQLEDMGFEHGKVTAALVRHNNNVERAVDALVNSS